MGRYTLAAGLIHKLYGTTFSNPTKRGIYASQKKALFTLQDVTSFVEKWIEEHYHREVHTGTGRAPIMFWSEQIAACSPMTLTQEEADALARRPVRRQIRNGQVTISGISYFSPALKELQLEGETLVTVLVDDLNLNSVLIQHASEKNTLIRAYSNEPRYTEGLTSYAHEQAQEVRKELAEADRCKVGQIDNLIALGTLLERIHDVARTARKIAGRLTNGMGKRALKTLGVSRDADVVPISSSSTVSPSEQQKVEPDSNIESVKQDPSQPRYFDTFSLED